MDNQVEYEQLFQSLILIHQQFKTIREIVYGDGTYYEDPASSAVDMALSRALQLYICETYHFPSVTDEILDEFYGYISHCIHNNVLFDIKVLDEIIIDGIEHSGVCENNK